MRIAKHLEMWVSFLAAASLSITSFGQGFPPAKARDRMQVPSGMTVTLVASEPQVRQPILVKCDDRGRLWIIQYLQYPNPAGLQRIQVDRYSRTVYDRVPEPPPRGPQGADVITILQDTNGDGRADSFKNFTDGLNLATGLAFGHGGVFVLQVPYLLFYPDKDRNDIPDGDPEVLLEGFGMEDSQSFANHLTWGPDGWLYGVNGSTTTCRIRGLEFQQGVWRYHPRMKKFELFCEGGGNLFGLTFDANGNLFYSSNGNFLFFHAMQGAYYPKNYGKHGPLHNLHAYGTLSNVQYTGAFLGPTTGGTVYQGDSLGKIFQGTFVAGNFLGHTASWWRVTPRGSTFAASLGGSLLDARDSWFGPTDLCLGPDGSIYICDFYDQRTAHPDPDAKWDRSNGRVYKIQAMTAQPLKMFDLSQRFTSEIVELLSHPNGWFAEQALVQLAARQDSALWPTLSQQALQTSDPTLAVRSLWALYVSGGWDDDIATRILKHPAEYVRTWGVRFVGDAKQTSPKIAKTLVDLAASETSVVVRAQLAASAKRLPATVALPVVARLLDRNLDEQDPHLPWLLWWALEDKATSDMEQVMELALDSGRGSHSGWRDNLCRLVRRYAAEGTASGYAACQRLLDAAPSQELDRMLAELNRGLTERARALGGMGSGDLFQSYANVSKNDREDSTRPVEPLDEHFRKRLQQYWLADQGNEIRLRLALQAKSEAAATYASEALKNPESSDAIRISLLAILSDLERADNLSVVLSLVKNSQSEKVQIAALSLLTRFSDMGIAQHLIQAYPTLSPAVQARTRELLLSHPDSAKTFLQLVEMGQIAPSDVPLDQLRIVALHGDSELDVIVRKFWGNVRTGTAEEKLAEMRRISNDLRAGNGDSQRGLELFKKHCATCHKRQGEGGLVGPDLTAVSRDRDALLTSLIDPSVLIRSQYLTYIVTTTNGQILTGTLAEQDAASITLLDAKAERTRVSRDQIADSREAPTSLMPDNLLSPLLPQELRDLFSYLEM